MYWKESELSISRYPKLPESRHLTPPGSEDGLAQGVKQPRDDEAGLYHEGRVRRRNKGASRWKEHNVHRPKFRKDTEQSGVWLEQKPQERKGEICGQRVGKHGALKAFYGVKIYLPSHGELLRNFQEGSDVMRFSLLKDPWL